MREYLSRWQKIILYSVLTILCIPIAILYLYLIINAFNADPSFAIIPEHWTLQNWRFLWTELQRGYPSFWLVLGNTAFFTVSTMVVELVIAVFASYVISRWGFKGRGKLLKSIILLRGFPAIVLIVGIYFILATTGLLNRLIPVVFIKAAVQMPFAIWVMKGFFDNVPWNIERAAVIDGASRIQTLFKIVLPIVKPGIGALSVFAFLNGWGEYVFLVTFINAQDKWTLSVYLNSLLGSSEMFTNYGPIAAVSVFYLLPTLIFFAFTQEYLTEITMGGAKGT